MQRTKQRSRQEWKSVQGSLREGEGRVVYMNELCMAERKGGRGEALLRQMTKNSKLIQ